MPGPVLHEVVIAGIRDFGMFCSVLLRTQVPEPDRDKRQNEHSDSEVLSTHGTKRDVPLAGKYLCFAI